jgi:adenylate cyclase
MMRSGVARPLLLIRGEPTMMPDLTTVQNDPTIRQIVKEAVAQVGAQDGSLLLLDDAGERLRFAMAGDDVERVLAGKSVPVGGSITGLAVAFGQPMIVNNVQQDQRHYAEIDRITGMVTRSMMAVPLSSPAGDFGALTAVNARVEEGFTRADLERFEQAARRIVERLEEMGEEA